MTVRWLMLALGALLPACNGGPTDPSFAPGAVRVLFIGNSLTYTNDLPGMLVAVARQAGDSALAAHAVALANVSIEDHWYEGTARALLERTRWEFVVLQQGPSSLPANQANLAQWTGAFAPLIRAAGAEPVLYMVWPAADRALLDFPLVLESYREAARSVGGIFAPAGDAWIAALAADPAVPLYGPDGFHPSAAGTYVAALVLLGRLRGIDPLGLPAVIPGPGGYGADRVRSLQRAARAALDRNAARP